LTAGDDAAIHDRDAFHASGCDRVGAAVLACLPSNHMES
jgi:hypothetical protein